MKRTLLWLGPCLAAGLALASGRQPAPESGPRPDSPAPSAAAKPETAPGSPIWVSAEVRFPNFFSSLFYAFYAGDPVEFRLLIHNTGKEEIPVPRGFNLRGSVRVAGQDGKPLAETAAAWKDSVPEKLAPGQILGGLFDIGEMFPDFKKPDVYTIRFEAGEWKSNDAVVRVIPRYSRDSDYEATLETEEGEITIELYGQEAPVHVGNFVNLARLGYYDGMPFHTISRERSIRTGAPGPDGSGSIGYSLPAEFSSRRHVAGAVSMYRDQRRSGTDSDGTQFFICLTDLPNRDGKFTVLGQVKRGLEVAKKIGSRETVTDPSRPANTPKDPVKIRGVAIVEKPRPAPAKG